MFTPQIPQPSTGLATHGKLNMAITERERRDAYTGLEQTLGENIANTIMQLLPNQPADQLVTRSDMHAFGSELRGEMAELRGDLRGEMAELRSELRGEMAELRSDLRGEMGELRGDLKEDMTGLTGAMAELRGEFKADSAKLQLNLTRLLVGSMAANTIAVVTALAV